jgi:TonB-dependent starch-binding outer membrane protein SusC
LEGTNKVFNHGVGVLDRWKKEGDVAKNPKAGQAVTGSGNLRPSDRFVEDGSYLRVRNITLSYNLPKFSGPVGKVLQSARVYFTLQNFLTFTKYSGLDPEILGYDPLFGRGIDNYSPPTAKTWLVGINVGF